MASYDFAGSNPGLFGGGGIWGSNWGTPMVTGLNAGFDISQKLRTLQNQAALDPFTVPAIAAQADASRLNADLSSSTAEGQLAAILRALQGQQQQQPNPQGGNNMAPAVVAASNQAMQDQQMEKLTNPIVQRALNGGGQDWGLSQMLRLPSYQLETPGFGGGGGYGY